jgi:hypothetical protein
MAVLTLEFFSSNWVDAALSKASFAHAGDRLDLPVSSGGDSITVRKGESYLNFEFYDEASYKWFVNQYPVVENEPESQIPYYWVDEIAQVRLCLVAESTNSVWNNENLAFLFSLCLLKNNPNLFVAVNREVALSALDMRLLEKKSFSLNESWYLKSEIEKLRSDC